MQAETQPQSRRQKFLAEIRAMTYAELLDLKVFTDATLVSMRDQLDRAKAEAVNGEVLRPEWFARARAAAGYAGWRSQAIQTEIAKRRREDKDQHARMWERVFVDVARRTLDRDTWQVIAEQATVESATLSEAAQ